MQWLGFPLLKLWQDTLGDKLGDLTVKLITLMRTELLRGHLVVFDNSPVLLGDPLDRLLLGAILVFVDKHEAAAERLGGRRGAVKLAPRFVIEFEILLHRLPGLLRNHQ